MGIFRRIGALIKGFLSLFISGVEKQAPKALLENEIQSFNTARATFNENLAKQGDSASKGCQSEGEGKGCKGWDYKRDVLMTVYYDDPKGWCVGFLGGRASGKTTLALRHRGQRPRRR